MHAKAGPGRGARRALAIVAAALLAGCGAPRSGDPGVAGRGASGAALDEGVDDLGLDVEASPGGRGPAVKGASGGGGGGGARPTTWTVVLATFPADAQADAPGHFAEQLRGLFPPLRDVWIHAGPDGAVVAYGRYEGPQSEAARRDLKMIKDLKVKNAPAFPTAMLSRLNTGREPALNPLALMSLRLRYPNLVPLYTLEVAVWGDFESNKLTVDEIHRQAEGYARSLRAQGVEAWFHHDDDKHLSSVTVGLFDHKAIDPRTGLLSAEVEALRERFPARLVNGEELREPVDGRDPRRGTRVQKPMLVEVPKR